MTGWIKIHRKMTEWEWYDDIPCRLVFIHLLITANYEDSRWQGRVIKRGQVVTGRHELARETGLSEQQIRTVFGKLKSTSDLTIKTTNKFSIVTIVNYEEYQDKQPASNQQSNQQPNQQSTTSKEVKKKEYNNPPIVPPKRKNAKGKKTTLAGYEKTNGELSGNQFGAFCEKHGVSFRDIEPIVQKFRAKCEAQDYRYVNFHRAFEAWDWGKEIKEIKDKVPWNQTSQNRMPSPAGG